MSACGPLRKCPQTGEMSGQQTEADISPSRKDGPIIRYPQIFARDRLYLTDGPQCTWWLLSSIFSADTRKVSGPDVFRNYAKSFRHFKGHFPEWRFQVRILAPHPNNPDIVFSVTFEKADSKPHQGTLAAGGKVTVKKKGTEFDVTQTNRS